MTQHEQLIVKLLEIAKHAAVEGNFAESRAFMLSALPLLDFVEPPKATTKLPTTHRVKWGVRLREYTSKLEAIKCLREHLGLSEWSLAYTKRLVEQAPVLLQAEEATGPCAWTLKETALSLVQALHQASAIAEVIQIVDGVPVEDTV